MDGNVVLEHSVCRACLDANPFKKYPLTGNVVNLDIDIASMLEFCISKKLDLNEDLPDSVCLSCFKTIRIAYKFLKQFSDVQEKLKTCRIKNELNAYEEIVLFEEESKTEEITENDQNYKEKEFTESFKTEENLAYNDSESEVTQYIKNEYNEDNPDLNNIFNLHSDESKIELIIDTDVQEEHTERLYRYICPICGQKFCRIEIFYSHVLGYKLSKISCPRCLAKPEYEVEEYFKHYRELHRYHCDICDKRLVSSYGYHYHMKQHKTSVKYECTYENCKRSFTMRHLWKKHLKVHIKNTIYSCNLCSATFKTNDSLRYHLKIHKNKKDHLCTMCGRTFFQAVHLRDHMYRHMGYKKFICDKCGKSFITNSSLKKHMDYCSKKCNRDISDQKVYELRSSSECYDDCNTV